MDGVDVAVVGGGPAGSTAAWMAAKAGKSVHLLEAGVPRADRPDIGPDSTDAGGLLDYWLDLMGIPLEEIPSELILRYLDGADFVSPNQRLSVEQTGFDTSLDHFGVTIDRVGFDDWLRQRAIAHGATIEIGTAVTAVESSVTSSAHSHTLTLSTGERIQAEYLILADGPQRRVTIPTLEQFTSPDTGIGAVLDPSRCNHIAYQEYRQFPPEIFDERRIRFWWGHIPGHTAYPWVFPNDGTIARVGVTMPIGQDGGSIDPTDWPLLRATDTEIPPGNVLIERLLDQAYPEYDPSDFPVVTQRGKRNGSETYPISSTRPIESPTAAGIAVVGGAMGGTSAFHEGGYHIAVRTGRIAGYLAGIDQLDRYNDMWKQGIGHEVLRNVAMAEVVKDYDPRDWDRLLRTVDRLLSPGGSRMVAVVRGGFSALSLGCKLRRTKRQLSDHQYVQFPESAYHLKS